MEGPPDYLGLKSNTHCSGFSQKKPRMGFGHFTASTYREVGTLE